MVFIKQFMMKKKSLSGIFGISIFIAAFVFVCVAFGTSAWLTRDYRITGAQFQQLGLWRHCFGSLPDPVQADAPTTFFVGCRWVYDPFTHDYKKIRGFLLPPFMIGTQVFFTICFVSCLIAFGLILFFGLCGDPKQRHYVKIITLIGFLLLFGGICGVLAVIIFACFGNTDGWMPGNETNYFGWSFVLASVGSVLVLIASLLFLVEANVQRKKRYYMKESQARFEFESRA